MSDKSGTTAVQESAAATHERLDTTRSAASAPLSALCLIARLHHLQADPVQLAHRLGWSPSFQPQPDDVLLAAQQLGLKAKRVRTTAARLGLAPLPALAVMRDPIGNAHFVVLGRCDGPQVLYLDPKPSGLGQVPQPMTEQLDAFAQKWTGELILMTSRASLAGELARFDFSWFIPSLVRRLRVRKLSHRDEQAHRLTSIVRSFAPATTFQAQQALLDKLVAAWAGGPRRQSDVDDEVRWSNVESRNDANSRLVAATFSTQARRLLDAMAQTVMPGSENYGAWPYRAAAPEVKFTCDFTAPLL